MKKFVGMVVGAFCMALMALLFVTPVQAEAAGRNVEITWDTGSSDWYVRIDSGYWMNINGVFSSFEDGDIVVVNAAGATPSKAAALICDKRLDTLAVTGDTTLTITLPKGIGTIYPANGATLICNGDADYAIGNGGCITQINGNVGIFEARYEATRPIPIFAVTGTVGLLKAHISDGITVVEQAYNFEPGTVHCYAEDYGYVNVPAGSIKTSPTDTTPAKGDNGKKELDKVPKTGTGVYASVLFFALAAALAITGVTVKRRESVK